MPTERSLMLWNFPQLLAPLGAPRSAWPAVSGPFLSCLMEFEPIYAPTQPKTHKGPLRRSPEFSLCGTPSQDSILQIPGTLASCVPCCLSLQLSKTSLGSGDPTMPQSENCFQAVGGGNFKAHLLYFLSFKVHMLLLLMQDLKTIVS